MNNLQQEGLKLPKKELEALEEERQKLAEAQAKQEADALLQRHRALHEDKVDQRGSFKTVVIAFGRFNPPTIGHQKLVNFVASEARRLGADVVIFPSVSQDAKKNPIPFRDKVRFLKLLFPQMNFSEATNVKTPIDALFVLSKMGYKEVILASGSDRVTEYLRFEKYCRPKKSPGFDAAKHIDLQSYKVVEIPRSIDVTSDYGNAGTMSATMLRDAAMRNDFESYAKGTPTKNAGLAKQIFNSVRLHQKAMTEHKILYFGSKKGFQRLLEAKLPVTVENISALSYPEIRKMHRRLDEEGYFQHILVHTTADVLSEDVVQSLSTRGQIQQGLARDVINVDSIADMLNRVQIVVEAGAVKAGQAKTPSEVDRMRVQQQRELLMTKQRQENEMQRAKERELQKKSREKLSKLGNNQRKESK